MYSTPVQNVEEGATAIERASPAEETLRLLSPECPERKQGAWLLKLTNRSIRSNTDVLHNQI
jgi:hypothetical protein